MESNLTSKDDSHSTPIISNNPVLLYNPQNMDGEQLIKGFSIRKKEYKRIWQDVLTGDMKHPETHYLIQGVRGSGKTTILSRLAYDVANEDSLNSWLLPILFNEEEYGIYSLFTFWLRVAEELASIQPEHYQTLLQTLSAQTQSDAEQAWQLIARTLDKHQQKILVLMDNMGEKFDDFNAIEHAQLREVLSLSPQIRLIGASSVIWETHFDATAPFYQFFKLVTLKSIDEENMHALLRSLAKQTGDEAVQRIEDIINQNPERIEAVRRLTDGVPRTIVLLFQIIMEGAKDSSYAYLEETIDKTTPLYKHRMDDLAPQQRVIVNAMAMNWDAMNAKEIADVTRLPSKTVSAQLAKLHKGWIVDKIQTNTKNHLYIIKERFFNIWYLMRFGKQTDKRRVLWLTRFLDAWCDEGELLLRIIDIAQTLQKNKNKLSIDYTNALLASEKLPYILRRECQNQLSKDIDLIEINPKGVSEEIFYIQYLLESSDSLNFEYIDKSLKSLKKYSNDYSLHSYITIKIVVRELYSLAKKKNNALLLLDFIEKNILNQDYVLVSDYLQLCFKNNIHEKKEVLIKIIENQEDNAIKMVDRTICYLWNGMLNEAISQFNQISYIRFDLIIHDDIICDRLFTFFILLLAKNQTESAYKLLIEKGLKETFKPLYYATVSLLPDERNQEYLRMGSELQSTVDEILQRVEEYRERYA